jgi:large subunit ribosomal protein L18
MKNLKVIQKERRKARVKGQLKPNGKLRLVAFKSLNFNYLQLVDDEKGATLAASSDLKSKKGNKLESAKAVGLELAKKAKELKIEEVVFDRNGYKYHGRIKAMAEGAREGGLKF